MTWFAVRTRPARAGRGLHRPPRWRGFLRLAVAFAGWLAPALAGAGTPMLERLDEGRLRLSNGIATLVVEEASASVLSLVIQGVERVNASPLLKHRRIYWSLDGGRDYENLTRARCRVHRQDERTLDLGCRQTWSGREPHPVDIDIHLVLRDDTPGVYLYAVLEHPARYPALRLGEWRVVWQTPVVDGRWLMERLHADEARQLTMPSVADYARRIPTRIREISILASGPWQGRAESKYSYAATYEDIGTFGFASDLHRVGAFVVLGGFDYLNDGPRQQDLTVLEGMMTFHLNRNHYRGTSITVEGGEAWSKLFGPFLLYGNAGASADALWRDARNRAALEQAQWPYAWLQGQPEHPPPEQRGAVRGRLVLKDPLQPQLRFGRGWVGLAQPPSGADFQQTANTYQYWVRADADGRFAIEGVRPGRYTLFAFTDGAVGEFRQDEVTVGAGDRRELGDTLWTIDRVGARLAWTLGVPDRDSREFANGPDAAEPYLHQRFGTMFDNPLSFTVGRDDPARAWNYAHTAYPAGPDGPRVPWVWQLHFDLVTVPADAAGEARLLVALAGSNRARLRIALNGRPLAERVPRLDGGNALLRQASRAKAEWMSIPVPLSALKPGRNTLELVQTVTQEGSAIFYDHLALEVPEGVR